jgi:streptogramin lyase
MWFTETNAGKIGKISPADGKIIEYTIPNSNGRSSKPIGIISGPDGNLWFTDDYGGKIGRFSPNDGEIIEYQFPVAGGDTGHDPADITAGPDGNLWFIEPFGHKIGKISPTTGSITEYNIASDGSIPAELGCITAGPDVNLWFIEIHAGSKINTISSATSKICNISPFTGNIISYDIPTEDSNSWIPTEPTPFGITLGPDGNLWFTEEIGKIGKISPRTGIITEYPLPFGAGSCEGITAGPDGNLWFTEPFVNKIGKISPIDGKIIEYVVNN